jgi:PAS domain S-box-containing protein
LKRAPATPRRARPAALHLVYFALIVAGPLLLVIGALLWRSVSLERQQLDSRLGQVLEALVADLDRDFDRQVTILRTLESSPLLAAGNWPAFYEQARNALRDKGYVVLVDLDGRQIVNTYAAYGAAPERTGDPETIRRIREAPGPVVSNLFVSKVTRQPVYNVSIPVPSGDDPRFIMSIGLLPKDLLAILKEQGLDDRWNAVTWDGNGQVLAQLDNHDHAVGTLAPQALRALEPGKVTRIGMATPGDVFAITARGVWSDWGIAVAFSAAAIESQVSTSVAVWGVTILMVAAVVALLAWLFGRRLAGPLATATDGARALGRGEALALAPSGIVEIDAVNEALVRAQREVEASSAALRQSEEQLRTAAEAAEFGPHRYDAVNDRTYRSPQFLRILGAGKGEATASFAAGLDWVHPEDRETTATAKKAILAGREDRYQLDYRILRRDGTVRWVMDRGRIVREAGTGRALEVVGVVLDITDMKDAEQRQRLLFEELNHRVKNTLAIVQSLAKQTLRSKTRPAGLRRSLRLAAAFARPGARSSHPRLLERRPAGRHRPDGNGTVHGGQPAHRHRGSGHRDPAGVDRRPQPDVPRAGDECREVRRAIGYRRHAHDRVAGGRRPGRVRRRPAVGRDRRAAGHRAAHDRLRLAPPAGQRPPGRRQGRTRVRAHRPALHDALQCRTHGVDWTAAGLTPLIGPGDASRRAVRNTGDVCY